MRVGKSELIPNSLANGKQYVDKIIRDYCTVSDCLVCLRCFQDLCCVCYAPSFTSLEYNSGESVLYSLQLVEVDNRHSCKS